MSEPISNTATLDAPLTPGGHVPINAAQKKSLIAAVLGWLFDGLDMHMYGLVAQPFVALLMAKAVTDGDVAKKSSYIQAAFLVGWAIGGAVFGRLGDIIGRARSLSMTILVYACFTGLAYYAHSWWMLLIFRFVAALGIGGEWAVGSSLLAETWPARWRPWLAAVLQTGVNVGVLLAVFTVWILTDTSKEWYRNVFLVGIIPAVMVYWIRKNVPEPEQWQHAQTSERPGVGELFAGSTRRITLLTIAVCACSLTAWWAFMFWIIRFVRELPEIALWSSGDRQRLTSVAFFLLICVSIGGNFFGAWLAKRLGYRNAILVMLIGFFSAMVASFAVPHGHVSLLFCVSIVGFFSGVFGLFTMYLPPLFPTLLRTTGAGFCYNIGRIAAAGGTIFFGIYGNVDLRHALLVNSFLIIPAGIAALFLPNTRDV